MIIREAKLSYRKVGELDVDVLDSPEKIYHFLIGANAFEEYPDQEQFMVIPLNRKNRPIKGAWFRVTVGTASASLVHPREVLRPVLLSGGATAFVCAHNHPSGDPSPSQCDFSATRRLREAAKVMALDLLDHVIVGEPSCDPKGDGYYSFAESGLI